MRKSSAVPRTGQGALTIARESQAIAFSLQVSAAPGGRRIGKGSLTGEPEAMRQAFRAGDARLTLDDGTEHLIAIVAHTEGDGTAYFELR
ncbi:hypothetical protein SGCZBJ_13425 [Caulobacter zeae]|uniref:Uncharacterized protein n=1 Tax=Caulobacter zeae TaxID=2055137 RepID=A0A2N5DE91_9CAUL|nr:hypothetical protein [Caulobacter zeae]PLR24276.1 hypothetical protein SGCZBJ_13425 [Caulobacter zeae]